MGSFLLFYYALLILGAIGVIFLSFHLQRNYRIKYLTIYFYYLIATYVYWFLVFILPDLLLLILKDNLLDRTSTIYWLFILFSYPVIMIVVYLFASFFLNLSLENIPRRVVIAFFTLYVLLGLWMIYALVPSTGDTDHQRLTLIYSIMRILSALIRFGVIAFVFVIVHRLKSKNEIRFIRTICIMYFTAFAVYYIFRREIPFTRTDLVFYLNPFLYFLINIPPILYLRGYFRKRFRESFIGQAENINFRRFFEKYGLSPREQEIFFLLLDGKSNKDIEDALFISIRTVKNHVYSIFKKLNVNNRTQLLIQAMKLFKKLSE